MTDKIEPFTIAPYWDGNRLMLGGVKFGEYWIGKFKGKKEYVTHTLAGTVTFGTEQEAREHILNVLMSMKG